MNWSTVALMLLAWQLLGKNNGNTPKIDDALSFLSDDTKDILSCINTLSAKDVSSQDKTGAIFQMISNPTVMNIAQNLFGSAQNDNQKSTDVSSQQNANSSQENNSQQNDEGYAFPRPSAESQTFFAPINNVADVEIKQKLYWYYDNWYVAN